MVGFGSNPPSPGVWIAATTSLGLGNIDIDQAVVSAIANMMAAKVAIARMTPTSGSISPAATHLAFLVSGRV
jgi:hypothetical protein